MNNKIFQISNQDEFVGTCLEVFLYQAHNSPVYKEYIELLGIDPNQVKCIEDIPFLPISLFKSHEILCSKESDPKFELFFESSATTGMIPSRHYVLDTQLYERSFLSSFKLFYGDVSEYVLLALLPSYKEKQNSSLVYMIDKMIEQSASPESAYYLYNHEELYQTILRLRSQEKKIILFGVTFALLDFAKSYKLEASSDLLVFETGGMKGRGEELPREEVHKRLTLALGVDKIHSEYGMCELLSQAYSEGDGVFVSPPWMRVVIRDLLDPFVIVPHGNKGGINIIDLANINSCSFIETEDLGVALDDSSFTVDGRITASERRGCNMLIE